MAVYESALEGPGVSAGLNSRIAFEICSRRRRIHGRRKLPFCLFGRRLVRDELEGEFVARMGDVRYVRDEYRI